MQGILGQSGVSCVPQGHAFDPGILPDLRQLLAGSGPAVCGINAVHVNDLSEMQDTVAEQRCQGLAYWVIKRNPEMSLVSRFQAVNLKSCVWLNFCADASYDSPLSSLQSGSCCPTLCSAHLLGWIEQVLGICATYLVDYRKSYRR